MKMKMDTETKPHYETYDIYLAAALKIHGFKLITFNKDDRGRGTFVFEDKDNRPQLVQKYFSGELSGNLKSFVSAWRDLKGLLFELGKRGE
jgi:hypothetical protein